MYVSVLLCSPLNVCLKREQWVQYPCVGYWGVTKSELVRYLVLAEAIFLPTCSSSVSLYPFHFLYINILVNGAHKMCIYYLKVTTHLDRGPSDTI